MESTFDDADRLRARRDAAEADASRRPAPSARGAPCVLAKVGDAVGTDSPKFYSMTALRLTGAATEGSAGVIDEAGWTFVACNVGTGTPPADTKVLCTGVRDRWAFSY